MMSKRALPPPIPDFRIRNMNPALDFVRQGTPRSGSLTSPQITQIVKDFGQRQAAGAAADRLVPKTTISDLAGKLYAAPLTSAGIVAGIANVALARAAGDKRAGISVHDNGVQFESGHFGDKGRAFTLGNAVLHGPGSRPGDRNKRYDGVPTAATTAEHESGHTYQYQTPTFVPGYLLHLVHQALTGTPNPYEREADDFSEWKHRQKGGGR